VDGLLEAWPWWLLQDLAPQHRCRPAPRHPRARVLDCYLLEGHKVLFRAALALLKIFTKQVGFFSLLVYMMLVDGCPGAQLADRKGARYTAAKATGLEMEFRVFCGAPGVLPEELMARAFKFPRFSKADIAKLTARLEVEARSRKAVRRRSAGSGPPAAGEGLRALGDSLAVRQGLSTPQPRPRGALQVFPINDLRSSLLTRERLQELWSLLPDRVATVTPTLAYSTDLHGTSLTTFYSKAGHWEPSILVVRNTETEVFGAYCSTPWDERNRTESNGMRRTYFGTGECFLFRWDAASGLQHFPWVRPDSEEEEEEEESGPSARAKELFMSGDPSMITVGGGCVPFPSLLLPQGRHRTLPRRQPAVWADRALRYIPGANNANSLSCLRLYNQHLACFTIPWLCYNVL
jgi:hypothetical protein